MFQSLRMKRFLIHCANVLLTSPSSIPRYHILQLSLQRNLEFNAYYDATMFSSYLTAYSIAIGLVETKHGSICINPYNVVDIVLR